MALSAKKTVTDKRHQSKPDRMVIQPYKAESITIRAAGQSLQGYNFAGRPGADGAGGAELSARAGRLSGPFSCPENGAFKIRIRI